MMTLWDNGSDEYQDVEWGKDSYCFCINCEHEGTVSDFKYEPDEEADEEEGQ